MKMQLEDFLKYHNINLNVSFLPSYIKGSAYYNGYEYLVLINNRCRSKQQRETTVMNFIKKLIHFLIDNIIYSQEV